jgi:putative aldouronate transport system substrate-binding protein
MPLWYAANADKLPSATVDGKYFCIPGANPRWNSPIMIIRKDWFPEGMDEVRSLDDLGAYFENVKATQPGIDPFAMDNGLTSWLIGAYAFGATNLMAPGGPNCTSAVCFNKTDEPDYKLMRTWEQPQLAEFFKKFKEFADKGYWSPDVMNNPVNMNEAFQSGQSAVAWATNIETINYLYSSMKQLAPEAELAAFDLGLENDVRVDTYSPMGGGMAIPRTGANIERSLMLAELLFSDPDVYHIFRYGIEGEDYTLNEAGEIIDLDFENDIGHWPIYGNLDNDFVDEGGYWPGWDDLRAQIRKRLQQNPFVGFGLDTTPISDIANNLFTIHMEYAMPIYLGFVDDVDAAIEELNRQYELAGIEQYEAEVFAQLQAYLESSGIEGYTVTK